MSTTVYVSRKISIIGKHTKRITCGEWSKEGLLALGSEDHTITITSAEGDPIRQAPIRGNPLNIQFSEMKGDERSTTGENTVCFIVVVDVNVIVASATASSTNIENELCFITMINIMVVSIIFFIVVVITVIIIVVVVIVVIMRMIIISTIIIAILSVRTVAIATNEGDPLPRSLIRRDSITCNVLRFKISNAVLLDRIHLPSTRQELFRLSSIRQGRLLSALFWKS